MDRSASAHSSPGGSPRELTARLQAERRRADILKQQLAEAMDSLNEMKSVEDARLGQYPVALPEQAKLLQDAQQVVLELKADLVTLQEENSKLRKMTVSTEAHERHRELQIAFDNAVEKHRRETKENRFKMLRLQQEKQKLKIQVSELELDLSSRPRALVMEEEAEAKIDLLETANEELRRDNAALREEKLTYMTTELQRLHPSGKPKPDSHEAEIERLNHTVDALTSDLAVAKQRIKEYTEKTASQDELLERRTAEYEALLQSRKAELETMGILSNSLQETQQLYEGAQHEISKLQEENRELISEAMMAAAKKDREKHAASPVGSVEEAKSMEEMKEELAMVKKTASGAISTLSNSLKKSLLQSQELCQSFERDRLEMKQLNDAANTRIKEFEERLIASEQREAAARKDIEAKDRELQSFKQQMEEQRLRTKEAKQRLKAEILDTKQLIKSQQEDFKEDLPEDDDYLALLNIPKRARELFNTPIGLLEE